jgi:predicted  nucleic acid-binding Zn-ribbon protein
VKTLLEDLISLQNVEIKIFKASKELEEIPRKVEDIMGIIMARKSTLDAVDEELAALEDRKKPLDAELQETQEILDASDARIKKIKTNKEHMALQREVEIAKKRKADIEEQILNLMERTEKGIQEKGKLQASFNEGKTLLDEKISKLQTKAGELKSVVDTLNTEAGKLRKTVDPTLLSRYERMKKNKNGLVVVSCDNGVCSGCHMHIPPQLFNEIMRGEKLNVCPVCQRVLYTNVKPKARKKVEKEAEEADE